MDFFLAHGRLVSLFMILIQCAAHTRTHKPPRRDQTHMHKSTANRFDTRPERQSHLHEYAFSVHTVCVWAQLSMYLRVGVCMLMISTNEKCTHAC